MARHKSWTDEDLRTAAKNNKSLAGLCRSLNLSPRGSRTDIIKHLEHLGVNLDHWTRQAHRPKGSYKYELGEILIQDSPYTNSTDLKKRLWEAEILEKRCYLCGCSPIWRSEYLELELDHINGSHRDNRLKNLRILCPNCHSQQGTRGRKKKTLS